MVASEQSSFWERARRWLLGLVGFVVAVSALLEAMANLGPRVRLICGHLGYCDLPPIGPTASSAPPAGGAVALQPAPAQPPAPIEVPPQAPQTTSPNGAAANTQPVPAPAPRLPETRSFESPPASARAPGPGLAGGRRTATEPLCFPAPPGWEIKYAEVRHLSGPHGGRGGTSPLVYTTENGRTVRACTTLTAYSESKSFGGGGGLSAIIRGTLQRIN